MKISLQTFRRFSLTAGILFCSALPGLAGDIKIIANPDIHADTISLRHLKSVFLGEKTSLNGVHVEPVLEKEGAAHETFLREYLGRSPDELQNYYMTLVVTGRGSMPKVVNTDADVVDYVSKTRGAIGYVSSSASTPGVKTLSIEDDNQAARKLITRIEPEYPVPLKQRSIGGVVRLKLTIAANGSVENAELLGGNPILGEAAVAAVTKWKYAPAASRSTLEVSIPFDPNQ